MEKQAAATKEAGEKNAAEGEKFLAENKKKEGVKTTASGLAIQSPEGRHRRVAEGDRYGRDQLQRHPAGWDGIR